MLGMYGRYAVKVVDDIYALTIKNVRLQTMNDIISKSKITCPSCGFTKEETMTEDACVFFYECEACKEILKPLPGDCCVFCSYGDVKCPPVQAGYSQDSCCKE